ncbi:hypothetical protein [Chryseobacterium sp. M5A1_1a]
MLDKTIITNNEQSSVKERLLKFIEYKRINSKQFEDMAGLSTSYISNMRKSIKPSTFDEKISPVFPELNKIWLLHGDGEMIINENLINIQDNQVKSFKELPIGDQLTLLRNEVIELRNELKLQKEEYANNTNKIIDFVDEYLKPVFDFMQISVEHKKKDNFK